LGHDDGLDTLIATLETVDHRGVEWARVRRTAYLIHQHLRYEYPGRITDLRQRLMLVPPEQHGGQRLITHRLEVSAPDATTRRGRDDFGNLVLEVHADEVDEAVDFTAWIVVERDATLDPARLPADDHTVARLLEPSPLTTPDAALHAIARDLAAGVGDGRTLAERINGWVQAELRYAPGTTGVRTTAAEALAQRSGVCQDFAHVMLALCRLGGLPARYVSGHLLGEGGTHAWVEALLPDPARAGQLLALPLDPTHGREAGLNYITVAVGRDYRDVAPTSGSFRAPYGGRLSARKRAGLTALDYADA
jgi:transglutaminase-like putative cysteine protease